MKVAKALAKFLEEEPVIVEGLTFEPREIYKISLKAGADVYWIKNDNSLWLSIDIESEETVLFQELDEELEAGEETLSFGGKDYEFSYEESGKVLDEDDEEIDGVEFREFEDDTEVMRIVTFEVTGDAVVSIGHLITEDDLQEI